MRHKLLAASALASALLTVPAYAETVTFWQFSTNPNDIAAWNAIIDAFEASHEGIDVVMEIVPWSEQQQRLVTALTTGGLPDVSMLGNNVVAQFQAIGALAPLDDAFAAYDEANGTDVASDIWPGDRGYYHLDNHWWASPIAVETRALYYRKDLFEAAGLDPNSPPDSWDELRSVAKTLTASAPDGTYGMALSTSLDYFTVHNFMSAYLGYGARMLNEDGSCGFDSPEFRAALDVYTGIALDGSTHPDAASMNGDAFQRGFLDGRYGMILMHPSLYRDLATEKPEWLDAVDIAKVPAGPANRSGFLGGWPLVMWDASDAKDAAGQFIMFATHGDAFKDLAVAGGFIPGSISLAQGAPWTEFPYPVFVEQLQDARAYQYPSEAIPQMGQLEVDTIQKAVQAVALGQKSIDQATADLCTDINTVLAR
ncbi:ABC transporter substrate-binding protein [Devosia faecipullorum]|uniref:ABC transporter substrate-binding protein n=1 Tax=Devosia faecipullorum TaxID=2755039 RepID=UPI00187B8B1F|nr:sugar ABC transporter substrate-binding protein [Devosia faecipullorum]MBE7733738.1 sugar ABC transporter substrate-binding protein [Devosia faecipullorum]